MGVMLIGQLSAVTPVWVAKTFACSTQSLLDDTHTIPIRHTTVISLYAVHLKGCEMPMVYGDQAVC
jgi:hypothetical protein